MPLKKSQREHQARIIEAFAKEHKDKFLRGAVEHDSDLENDFNAQQLVEFAIEEVLDLASYLYTLRDKLEYSEEQ